jgi:hypothetical protein
VTAGGPFDCEMRGSTTGGLKQEMEGSPHSIEILDTIRKGNHNVGSRRVEAYFFIFYFLASVRPLGDGMAWQR